jgi:predicted dehydrogenase
MAVRWGVIGCGGIAARRTIPEFKEMVSGAKLVSVMDVSAERAKDVAAKFGIPHFCTTEEELLAQDLDVVYIATPQDVHCRQVIKAAAAGKHILCEKPMAVSSREVDEMAKAIAKAKVKFMLGFCMRNNVYNVKARELVQAGKLGKIVMGRAELTCWYPPMAGAWRQDAAVSHGGSLVDMGTHCLDILEWIMGSNIVEVTGFQDLLVQKYRTHIEDTSTIVARFANGAHGIIDNYFNVPDASAQNSLELQGTLGAVFGRGTIGQDPTGSMFSILQQKETGYDANQVRNVESTREEYTLRGIGLYGQMIEKLSRCIEEGKEPPVTVEDGRHSVALVEAIYRSAKTGRVVKVAG